MVTVTTSKRRSRGVAAHDERVPVIVVDPLPVVRAGLAMLIDARSDLRAIWQTGQAEEALAALDAAPPGCVVIVGLGLDGPHDAFWLIERIRERFPSSTVIASGARSDAVTISRALFSGAGAFVDKNVDPVEFLDSITRAVEGDMVLAGPPADWVGAIAAALERGGRSNGPLTDRECEVLTVAAEGLTSRQVAERLGVRERTITTHLTRIYGKLGVGSRVAALRAAAAAGLLSGPTPD